MTRSGELLIGEIKHQHLTATKTLAGTGTLDEAFAGWILGLGYEDSFALDVAVKKASELTGATRTYEAVAVLGYASSIGIDSDSIQESLKNGLAWLLGRVPYSQGVSSFETDGKALLGIALAAKGEQIIKVRDWMSKILERYHELRVPEVDKLLIVASASILGLGDAVSIPLDDDLADMKVALSSRGVPWERSYADEEVAMKNILQDLDAPPDPIRSSMKVRVLDWISQEASLLSKQPMTAEDVLKVLDRIRACFKKWPWGQKCRWPIENEYHVQDLLWVILAPLFPDLEDEENLPSLGHKHPRCDLGIPSLHLIVEAKFLRSGAQSELAKITEEIAADHSLYLTSGSNYDSMIAVIWDNSRSSEQHEEIRQALAKLSRVVGSVIISRPARMT